MDGGRRTPAGRGDQSSAAGQPGLSFKHSISAQEGAATVATLATVARAQCRIGSKSSRVAGAADPEFTLPTRGVRHGAECDGRTWVSSPARSRNGCIRAAFCTNQMFGRQTVAASQNVKLRYRREDRGTNLGTIYREGATKLAFMRASGHHSVDPSPMKLH